MSPSSSPAELPPFPKHNLHLLFPVILFQQPTHSDFTILQHRIKHHFIQKVLWNLEVTPLPSNYIQLESALFFFLHYMDSQILLWGTIRLQSTESGTCLHKFIFHPEHCLAQAKQLIVELLSARYFHSKKRRSQGLRWKKKIAFH